MKNRSNQKELMDLGPTHYTTDEYNDCLKKLGLIGFLLGGDRAALQAFKRTSQAPKSILEVGCGNGAFAIKLAEQYPNTKIVGIDINHDAIAQALIKKEKYELKTSKQLANLHFEHTTTPELRFAEKSFDIVTATLLCHHLNDDELIDFVRAARNIACTKIILNDLQRSRVAYAAFWLLSPFFRNRLIRTDGLISITRAFTRKELEEILQKAGVDKKNYTITWKWAFRWIITINP